MRSPASLLAFGFLLTALAAPAFARLGETEAQSRTRYGEPKPELIAPTDKPLLEGANEIVFGYEGWRVRAAFLNGVAVRMEYVHIPEGGLPKKFTQVELDSILDAEKGAFRWREEKPRTGYAGLNALKTALEGRHWERSDHATAKLALELVLTIDSRDVEAFEKKRAKLPAKATPAGVPKF